MTDFTPGVELSRAFYDEVVAGIIGDVPHSAALLGEGSEVLGFDTERSTDHGWGLRLQVFVEEEAVESLSRIVEEGLPTEFRGWPVRYFRWQTGRMEHHVEISTLGDWLKELFGCDPRPAMTTAQWLSTPQQLLLQATRGAVYRAGSSRT